MEFLIHNKTHNIIEKRDDLHILHLNFWNSKPIEFDGFILHSNNIPILLFCVYEKHSG